MELVGRLIDRTIGVLIRWLGGQWARGRERTDRQRDVLRELATAMGEVVADSTRVGHGYGSDAKYQDAMVRAELRTAALATEVESEAVRAAAASFRAAALPVINRNPSGMTWEQAVAQVREAHDAAILAIQSAQKGL